MSNLRETLENRQVIIYLVTMLFAAALAFLISDTSKFEVLINPALALMLFVTFLQVPIAELKQAVTQFRFLSALIISNFVAIPILVFGLIQFLPDQPLLKLGVLLVLLAPCIDYVVTFTHLAKADAKLLLAATPILLILQMIFLPIYLSAFLGADSAGLIHLEPFIHAFIFLILLPLVLSILLQFLSKRFTVVQQSSDILGYFPVPATALVLFIVILAVVPQLTSSIANVLQVIPIYIAFAIFAPIFGLLVGRFFKLEKASKHAVAFSSATRNSLVVLPLALAIPGAIPLLPAIIVTQTLIELIFEVIYVRVLNFDNQKEISSNHHV